MKPECRPISLTTRDAVARARGLDVRAADHVDRGGERALEAEAPVDEVDVVVDRLGDADDADEEIAPADLVDELHRASKRPVAPDDEQDADVELVEAVDHLARVLVAARGSERRPASVMDVGHRRGGELDRFVAALADEPPVPVAKAEDLRDAVAVRELEHEPADHVVDAGAEPAARHDPAAQAARVEEDAVARARQLEGRRPRRVAAVLGRLREAIVEQDPVRLTDVVNRALREAARQGRRVAAGAEDLDVEVRGDDATGSLGHGQRDGHRRENATARSVSWSFRVRYGKGGRPSSPSTSLTGMAPRRPSSASQASEREIIRST